MGISGSITALRLPAGHSDLKHGSEENRERGETMGTMSLGDWVNSFPPSNEILCTLTQVSSHHTQSNQGH